MPTVTEKVPTEALRLSFESAVELRQPTEKGERTKFTMLAHSGQPMQHWLFGTMVVDLAGLRTSKMKKPVLLEHDPEKRVGYTESFSVTEQGLSIDGHFLKTSKLAEEIIADSRDGFPFEASISFERVKMQRVDEGETTEVNGYEFAGPGRIVRESEFREVSFVALGADMHTSAEALAGNGVTEQIEVTSRKDTEMSKDDKAPEQPAVTVDSIKANHPDIAEQLSAEGREAAISDVVEVLAAAQEGEQEQALTFLRSGLSVEKTIELLGMNPSRKQPAPEPKDDKKSKLDALASQSPESAGPNEDQPESDAHLPIEQRWAKLSRDEKAAYFGDFEQFKWAHEGAEEVV